MSYCRFSSDNFCCDVYVYHSVGDFWAVHVAGSRYNGVKNLPKQPEMADFANQDEWINAFVAHSKATSDFLRNTGFTPIDLPYAGQSFDFGSPGDCANFLKELQVLGYDVPDYAISTLLEEQEELDNDPDAAL